MKILLCALSFTIYSTSLFAQHVPKPGLLAHYPFSSNVNDSSGNGYHMNAIGVAATQDRFGRVGKAFTFDGIDDIITYSSLLPVGGNFSWSFWLKIESIQNSLVIFNGEGNTNGFGFAIGNTTIGPAGSHLAFFNGGINYNFTIPLQILTWHHVVLTKDNVQFKVYLDNVLMDSTSNPFIPPIGRFYVGLDCTDGTNAFDGAIDDVVIYNRVLTLAEIDTLFEGCTTEITSQPLNTAASEGGPSSFFVTHLSTSVNFQWQMDQGIGYVDLSNAGPFSGVNTDSLKINGVSLALNNVNFRVIVSNDINCKDTSLPARLNVWPTSVNNIGNDKALSVYPNPSKGSFTVDLGAAGQISGFLDLYDLFGQLVSRQKVLRLGAKHIMELNVSAGLYILRASTSDGRLIGKCNIQVQ